MLRRFVHVVRANFALTVFWVYLAAFGVAFIFVFVLPVVSIALVLIGVLALVPAVLLNDLAGVIDRAATRPYLRKGICPTCKQPRTVALGPGELTCVACGSRFSTDGEELPAAEELRSTDEPRGRTSEES